MCGFTGWIDLCPEDKSVLEEMTLALKHRGPDAMGYYQEGPVALGHSRLAVIDLQASRQPMRSSDGRFALAYNGEIYNFRKLKKELKNLGHVFLTEGDTEVLLHALMQWKQEALQKLEGMFAFAFWDSLEEELLLARDPLGIKPLHFSFDGNRLLFASEIKAILAHPKCSKEIDPEAIGLFLECQYIPAPLTIYRDIRKLPAAHCLLWKKGALTEKRYWCPSYKDKFSFDEETALELLEKQLRHSVSSMLVSDVPIGAFISGGIDSSVIASLMSQEGGKVKLFHLCFDDSPHSEYSHALKTASFLGADFYPLIARPSDALKAIDPMITAFDEPFGDQAALPTLLLSELSRKHVTVVLSGEGADEVFAGYPNYCKRLKEAPLCSRLGAKFSPLKTLYPFLPLSLRKNRLVKAAARPLPRRYTTIPNLFDREMHSSVLSSPLHSHLKLRMEDFAEKFYLSCDSKEYLDRMLHVDTGLWLPDDLLTKMDRASMHYSLEARVPYLDHKLVEFAARLPASFKLNGNETKYLLKRLAEKKGLLPKEIIYRSKQGFALPLREWLAGDLKPLLDEALSPNGLPSRGLFRKGFLERLRKEEDTRKKLNAGRLWALLVLELWFQRYAANFRCN